MNLFALSGILIGVSSSAMAVLMFLIGRERLHYIFGVLCIAIAFWGFGAYKIATTQDIGQADFWWRITHVGIIFIPVLFTHFVYEFLGKKNKLLILAIYALGFFFLTVNFYGDLFITNMRWVFDQFYYDSPPGILYIPFTGFFLGLAGYSHFLLWKAYQVSPAFRKTQISYFFLATAIGFAGGGLSFLPVYHIDLYPFLNLTVFLYPIIITYAIIRKQLFDIRVILTQLLVGIIAILLLVNVFTSQSSFEYLWKGALLIAFLGAGYLLIRSVIDEIKYREQLQKAYAALKELDTAKSEFISIASHQLRTPLTAIKGYISLALEGTYGKLDGKMRRSMKNVYESNERLIRLVNDLLSISRIESGKMKLELERTDVQDTIKSVMEELQIKAQEKHLKLIFEEPEHALFKIFLDQEKIRNAISNIIDNAIRYTDKGAITVRIYQQSEPQTLLIEISDTGAGMTQKEISKLFESFSRGTTGTMRWTEGAGLGLYIAKQFVQMHKGKIWAESEGKGRGSTFFIELPVQKQLTEQTEH